MRILLIEDEYNLADAVAFKLRKEKYVVDLCTDGEEGLDNALTDSYDLIILDIMLPKIDGFEILQEIKNNNISSKVIMLTARNSIEDKLYSFNIGADDYLTKPFHMEELVARVNIQLRKNDLYISNDIIECGDLTLNISNMRLTCKNTNDSVDIIGKEFQFYAY